jgi:cell pole-organizing protein PopZ
MTDTTDTTETPEVAPLPSAADMVAAGAVPAEVDVNAMLAQIQALQASVARMESEKPAPTDDIAKAITDLADHVKARAAQNPAIDYSEILAAIDKLPKVGVEVTSAHTALLKELVHDVADKFRNHELGYVKDLATAAHIAVLKAAV